MRLRIAFLLIAVAVLVSRIANAQTAILLPPPKIQFFDFVGNPLAGGQVFTYQAGTSIQQATYTDSTGTIVNTDPIILDAAGFPSSPLGPGQSAGIYFINGASYRICVFNSNSVQQYCVDNVKLVSSTTLAGAANTQVLFDCAGLICGNAGFTFNSGTQTLSVVGLNVSAGGSLNGTFSGNPTFSGTVTITGNLVVNTLTVTSLSSACTPTASGGFIRMCKTDAINWRNNANSTDIGIGIDASDRFTFNFFPAAVTPTNVMFVGTTNAFPMWKRSGTQLQARLADDSADASLTASTLTFNGASGGVVISGPCTTGQVLTAASSVSVTCATQGAAILGQSTTTTLTNNSFGNANTTIISKIVTMPLTGCPCRVFAGWWLYLQTGASGTDTAYVSDGTNGFSGDVANTTGAVNTGAFFSMSSSSFSTVTYTNGAVVTFNLIAAGTHAGNTTVSSTPGTAITGAPNSSLNLVVYGSN